MHVVKLIVSSIWLRNVSDLLGQCHSLCNFRAHNTLHTAIGFTMQNYFHLLNFINFKKLISQITKQILGMFVLIWMHFSWWFQICSWNFKMLTFLQIFWETFRAVSLLTPAAWYVLSECWDWLWLRIDFIVPIYYG